MRPPIGASSPPLWPVSHWPQAVFSSITPIGSDWLQVFDLNTMTLEHVVDTPFYDVLGGGFAIGPRPSQ